MSLKSLLIDGFTKHFQAPAFEDLLLPLSRATVAAPTDISLRQWLDKPIDLRAPRGSVAMVDVKGDQFMAVVIDTVADIQRWKIVDHRGLIAQLYDGMLGAPGASVRGTVIVSAIPSRPVEIPK